MYYWVVNCKNFFVRPIGLCKNKKLRHLMMFLRGHKMWCSEFNTDVVEKTTDILILRFINQL